MRDQIAEEIGFHQGQREAAIADAQLQGVEIDRLSRKSVVVCRPSGPLRPTQQSADARQQNCQLRRFRQVIVGTSGEPSEHILRSPARSQHEDGDELFRVAQLRDHAEAVDAWKHDVEHDQIEGRL